MTIPHATKTNSLGLTATEVTQRVAEGKTNQASEVSDRTFSQVLRANAFTPVNSIMLVLFVLVIISGSWKDGLFVGVVVSNTLIGVTQEMKTRRELKKLQVLTEPKATVVRDGEEMEIEAETVGLDDLVVLTPGNQVLIDGHVLDATGLQLDESMLTGESDAVAKKPGDTVMSGSYIVAGYGTATATAVGDGSYASSLAAQAKAFSAAESHLHKAVNQIITWLTFIIPVASCLLLFSLLRTEDNWQDALLGTIAAAVAMVPDGLVLLTSLAFVAGILKLSRRKALAKQLSTVELLARVDVLCLDKTGTITTGDIAFADLHIIGGHSSNYVEKALATLAQADNAPNATMLAIAQSVENKEGWRATATEPFSSKRKWAAVQTESGDWLFLGAPDILLENDIESKQLIDSLSTAGQRLIGLATSTHGPIEDQLPTTSTPVAIVELRDEIRPDAKEIISYFDDQDVKIKLISGDNPATVTAIAQRAGLTDKSKSIDARLLTEDASSLGDALAQNQIFGRVTPQQKQDMVKSLQSDGHVVAMTGDGVNDVLALKNADLGIAMGSGSAASRSVADLVLTDDKFGTLPTVVHEGRKVINNVERVANLFVSKAVYAVLLTFLIGLLGRPFPFLPRQLTLIGTFSIGVPGFFLALSPEVERVKDGFLRRVLEFSIPAGVVAGTATFITYEMLYRDGTIPLAEARTFATIELLIIGLAILVIAARPLRLWKLGLAGAMCASYVATLAMGWSRNFFDLALTSDATPWRITLISATLSALVIAMIPKVVKALSNSSSR